MTGLAKETTSRHQPSAIIAGSSVSMRQNRRWGLHWEKPRAIDLGHLGRSKAKRNHDPSPGNEIIMNQGAILFS